MRHVVFSIAILACAHAFALGQDPTFSTTPPVGLTALRTVALDDVDNDGVNDYAVADPAEQNTTTLQYGAVRVISGTSGAVLATFWGGLSNDLFGNTIAAGDYDGNGTQDLFIATPFGLGKSILIYDPSTQSQLGFVLAPTSVPPMGLPIDVFANTLSVRDMDGDGMVEIMTSSKLGVITANVHAVHIFNGGTGSLRSTLSDLSVTDFGRKVEFLDDVNGDSIPEIVIATPYASAVGNPNHGFHGVYDTVTGTPVHKNFGLWSGELLGESLTVLDDMDGDGIRDYAVTGNIPSFFASKNLTTISGATGTVINTTTTPGSLQATDISTSVMDLDGDNRREIAIVSFSTIALFNFINVDIFSSQSLTHLDNIPATGSFLAQLRELTVVPDYDGNGFENILLGEFSTPGVPGTVSQVSLGPVMAHLPSAAGTHPNGTDLLHVSGQAGRPSRRVDLNVGTPFSIDFIPDPAVTGATDFVIFGVIGVPNSSTVYGSAVGNFVFPPRPAFPGQPWLFTLADSIGFDPASFFTPGPAPFSLQVPTGAFFPMNFALQGASITGGGTNVSVTNAVLLQIR